MTRPVVVLLALVLFVVVIGLVLVVLLAHAPSHARETPDDRATATAPPGPAPIAMLVAVRTTPSDADLDGILAPAVVAGLTVLPSVGYTVGYDPVRHRPRWAVYGLPGSVVEAGAQPPRPSWEADARVSDPIADTDWVGCGRLGYDRGHLAPSQALWSRFGRAGWHGTYVLTNAVPERRSLNGGRWSQLEALLAGRGPTDTGLAGRCAYLAIAVVPIYDDTADLDGDGDGYDRMRIRRPVDIPDAVAAIALDRTATGYRAWAWVTPNTDHGTLEQVAVTAIERRTGLDFNDELPPDLQAALESVIAPLP